jgi:hypothetical protein
MKTVVRTNHNMHIPTKARELQRKKKQQECRLKHRKGKAAARKLPPATVHLAGN